MVGVTWDRLGWFALVAAMLVPLPTRAGQPARRAAAPLYAWAASGVRPPAQTTAPVTPTAATPAARTATSPAPAAPAVAPARPAADAPTPPAAATRPIVPAAVDPETPGHRASNTLVVRQPSGPSRKPHKPLYRTWAFWAISGALVAGAAALTYAATRPAPAPYYGNVSPPIFTLP